MRDELWRIWDEGWGWGCKGDLLPDWLTDGQTDKQTLVIVESLLLLKRLKNWKQLWKDYTILGWLWLKMMNYLPNPLHIILAFWKIYTNAPSIHMIMGPVPGYMGPPTALGT